MTGSSILKRIRIRNVKNLLFPTVLLVLIIIFYIKLPIRDILSPFHITQVSDIAVAYAQDEHYIDLTVDTLYDTGLECNRNGKLAGRYYYTIVEDKCYFFLISEEHADEYRSANSTGPSDLENVHIRAKVVNNAKVLPAIIDHLSRELSWTHDGMSDSTSEYLVSELDYHYTKTLVIMIVLIILTVITLFYILYSLICIICPYLYKSVIKLRHYGKISKQLTQAEKELRENVRFNEGDFIITENYLCDCSKNDFQIIPLEQIVWAYKFSSYHPTRHHNHKVTYTLCVYGKYNVVLMSPYRLKIDADRVLDYLSRYYPDILFGYSKEYEKIAKLRVKSINSEDSI